MKGEQLVPQSTCEIALKEVIDRWKVCIILIMHYNTICKWMITTLWECGFASCNCSPVARGHLVTRYAGSSKPGGGTQGLDHA